ncbi:putative disease resistance protein RGA3 [Phalaenopsis equestris]|uniref:putative disease resistance protein RGA3 n=1 Tax=Phalaenopsis equestris TaxID=78828 RepID=UPI0009E3158F|nr:putative disease resistance protein RGA3 [Phalaenopsis equestris]
MSMILDAFVGKCLERLTSFIDEKAAMLLGVKEDLKKLQRLMVRIQKVLDDAERKRLEDSAINNWISELRDVMYDAEDIIDLCLIEGSQLLDEKPSSSSKSCCNSSFFSCFLSAPHRYEIGERINNLNGRLEEIYKDRSQFNLDHHNSKTNPTMVNSHQTSPIAAELEVVGREIEDATKELIKLMTRGDVRKLSVFAITGMGGIGKTTLAQKIFNHHKIQAEFQIKEWVCVSQNYNEIDLLKQMLRGAKMSYGDANTKAELEPLVRSAISGKSIFLVLDDVWRADVWIDLLRKPLHSAQIDALILITSRDENVAKQMGSVYIHPVVQLPVETGWEMLKRRLVMIGGREEVIYNLREIGIQIIEKCHGLPLAIKAMAGVLARKEPVVHEWKKVLNNNAWCMSKLPEELRGALYLSYDDLPSPLKQCFLYCSLFPADWMLFREDLVRLWVAEGFIKEEGHSLMEDTAEEYYHELTRRNLLQLNPLNYEGTYCKMHDLFRALAQFISRDEGFSGNVTEKTTIPLTKPRRLAVAGKGTATGVLGAIPESKCLRTLFIFSGFQAVDFKELVRFMHLRVLDLTENEIESIPNAIGDLVHLRHLDLDRTLIRELPESIGRLTNLQFLSLCGCKNLTYLPSSITQLQNLRRLALSDTPLKFIPKGIERLKQLNGLKGFVVGDDGISNQVGGKQVIMHSTLKELSSLSKLSILNLYNLERAHSGSLVLGQLSQLKELLLSCSPVHSNDHKNEEPFLIEKLFEELVPSKSLEQLYIKGYFGLSYPKWMLSLSLGSYLPYLSILDLVDNMSCPLLPPLGQLPQLRILYIAGANAVKCIGLEFLGGGVAAARSERKIAFPMLQLLTFHRMENLDEWFFSYEQLEKSDGSQKLVLFPRLHELIIVDCPRLRSLPNGLGRTGLKKLFVTGANRIKEVCNLTHIAEWVDMHFNPSLERISNLPALKRLALRECYALKYVESLDGLRQLELVDDSMDCLPEWLLRLIEERLSGREAQEDEDDFLLQLWCNERVLRRCLRGGEDWALIEQIPRLNAYVKEGEGYLRFVKQPFCYETNF